MRMKNRIIFLVIAVLMTSITLVGHYFSDFFTGKSPYYAKHVNTDVGIEIEFLGNNRGGWKAIIHPYDDYDEDVDAKPVFGGLVINGKKFKFPEDKNVVVINRKQESLFVDLDGIIITKRGRLVDVDTKKLKENAVWQETISDFLSAK